MVMSGAPSQVDGVLDRGGRSFREVDRDTEPGGRCIR